MSGPQSYSSNINDNSDGDSKTRKQLNEQQDQIEEEIKNSNTIIDKYETFEELQQAMRCAGLNSSNLIIGVSVRFALVSLVK